MTARNITGAAARLQSISVDGYAAGHNRPGMCLRWCYFAAGLTPNLAPASIAMDAWDHAPAEHRHPISATTIVPKDVPVILGPSPTRTDKNKNAGDVFFASADGIGLSTPGVMTDSPLRGTGYIGGGTIAQRAAQTGRPVLGYLTHWLGYDITTDALTKPPGAPAPSLQETDMAQMRLIRNNTSGDKKFGSIDAICVESGYHWQLPEPGYEGLFQARYNIKTEQLPAEEWRFWIAQVQAQRSILATAIWDAPLTGDNGTHAARARLVGADLKSGTASIGTEAAAAIGAAITIPNFKISGEAVAA